MQIVLHEIKKILNWKILCLITLVNIIFYFFMLDFEIKYFPNGFSAVSSYQLGLQMIEKYGTVIDEQEFADFKQTYQQRVKDAGDYLKAREESAALGMTDYQKFRAAASSEDEDQRELNIQLFFTENIDIFWELQVRESLIEFYEHRKEDVPKPTSQAADRRIQELVKQDQLRMFPEVSLMNYIDFISSVMIIVVISVCLVITPIFVRDRKENICELQYAAKVGRPLFKYKIMAGISAACIVITGLLAVYFSLYRQNEPGLYLNVTINRFGDYSWYSPTFLQYIFLTIVVIYLLGCIFALLTMSFSILLSHYIALIAIQIPFIAVVIALGLHYFMAALISIVFPQWLMPVVFLALLLASSLLLVVLWRREKKMDLLLK